MCWKTTPKTLHKHQGFHPISKSQASSKQRISVESPWKQVSTPQRVEVVLFFLQESICTCLDSLKIESAPPLNHPALSQGMQWQSAWRVSGGGTFGSSFSADQLGTDSAESVFLFIRTKCRPHLCCRWLCFVLVLIYLGFQLLKGCFSSHLYRTPKRNPCFVFPQPLVSFFLETPGPCKATDVVSCWHRNFHGCFAWVAVMHEW